jgi:hypothetical protein
VAGVSKGLRACPGRVALPAVAPLALLSQAQSELGSGAAEASCVPRRKAWATKVAWLRRKAAALQTTFVNLGLHAPGLTTWLFCGLCWLGACVSPRSTSVPLVGAEDAGPIAPESDADVQAPPLDSALPPPEGACVAGVDKRCDG